MVPAEETSVIPTEEASPKSATTPASTPEEEATMRAIGEPAAERRSPKFLGWEKVLHPFQPVMDAQQIPHPLRGQRLWFCNWEEWMV